MDVKKLPPSLLPRGRRHTKKLRDNIMGITRPAIRRLARRGGVIRIKKEIYHEIRLIIKARIAEVLRQVVFVLESGNRRKVINTRDIVYALSRMGNTLYGFD